MAGIKHAPRLVSYLYPPQGILGECPLLLALVSVNTARRGSPMSAGRAHTLLMMLCSIEVVLSADTNPHAACFSTAGPGAQDCPSATRGP